MSHDKNQIEKLENLLDAIEEQFLHASDAELKDDIVAAGEDPDRIANDVQSLIADQLKAHRQSRLLAAKEGFRKAQEKSKTQRRFFERQPQKARALLEKLIAIHSDIPEGLTMAFREGKEISDDDVQSILEDLEELGFVGDEEIE